MGVRASPVRGRGGGCAEAPLAGLPLDAKRGRGRAHRRNCYSSRQQRMHIRFRTAPFQGTEVDALLRRACGFHAAQSTSYTSTNSLRRLQGERTLLVRSCRSWLHRVADAKCAISQTRASGEGPAPFSNGLSLVPARPSTINPQGVRYASVRPLRLRLRGDRGRPRTRRRLSSGDGPRLKTGAFRCRTISPSLRTMPSIWPVR